MICVFIACCIASVAASTAWSQDFSGVPGSVISYEQSPDRFFGFALDPSYIGTPSITVLPDGSYLASHDLFGSGTDEDTVKVFRSTDKGTTWSQTATIDNAFWSTVFTYQDEAYLFGYGREDGTGRDILVRRSTDGGVTWTQPVDALTGIVKLGGFGGSANVPAIHDDRLWIAVGGTRVISAPLSANLLRSDAWTLSDAADVQGGPLGSGLTVTEGQAVASPRTGVTVLPKIGDRPHSVLLRVNAPADIADPSDEDWVSLPGGGKKFGVQYDATSDRFYALTNTVYQPHRGVTSDALTRTMGTLLSSADMVNWDVEKIVLFTPNIDSGFGGSGEGFQYFNFVTDDTDGDGSNDDLAIVSRTAMVVPGENRPPRGHDSNLMTFHTLRDFRSAKPDHYLAIEGGAANRFERTQHRDVPLGGFALGSPHDGLPLGDVDALAVDDSGRVYLREVGGRVLKYDLAGNFLESLMALPAGVNWTDQPLVIDGPGPERRTWISPDGGAWSDPQHWQYWSRPDTGHEIATLGSAAEAPTSVVIAADRRVVIGGLRLLSDAAYTVSGGGELRLDPAAGDAAIEVRRGSHELAVTVSLATDTVVSFTASGRSLRFSGGIDVGGHGLHVTGPGTVDIAGPLRLGEGLITLDGLGLLRFTQAIPNGLVIEGELAFIPDASLSLHRDAIFQLLAGVSQVGSERFDRLRLPELADGLAWNIDELYQNGTVTIVPEPSVMALFLMPCLWPRLGRQAGGQAPSPDRAPSLVDPASSHVTK